MGVSGAVFKKLPPQTETRAFRVVWGLKYIPKYLRKYIWHPQLRLKTGPDLKNNVLLGNFPQTLDLPGNAPKHFSGSYNLGLTLSLWISI